MLLHTIAFLGSALMGVSTADAARPARMHDALKAGCHVQQVHTPAGKIVQSSPIIRCSPAAKAVLAMQTDKVRGAPAPR